jgi:hypothetical protein
MLKGGDWGRKIPLRQVGVGTFPGEVRFIRVLISKGTHILGEVRVERVKMDLTDSQQRSR